MASHPSIRGYKGKTWLDCRNSIVAEEDDVAEAFVAAFVEDLKARGSKDYFGLNIDSRGWKAGITGETLAHLCVIHRKPKSLVRLVGSGCNTSIRDGQGSTPLDLALKARDVELIAALHGDTNLEPTREDRRKETVRKAQAFEDNLKAELEAAVAAKDRKELQRIVAIAEKHSLPLKSDKMLAGGEETFFTIVGRRDEPVSAPPHDAYREMAHRAHETLVEMDRIWDSRTKVIEPMRPHEWPSQVDLPIDKPAYNVDIQISTSSTEATLDLGRRAQSQFGALTEDRIAAAAERELIGASVVRPVEYSQMCVYGW